VDAQASDSPPREVGAAARPVSLGTLPPRPRRRRHRKHKSSSRGGSDLGWGQSDQPGNDEAPLAETGTTHHQQPCAIGWNSLMEKAEEDLKYVVSIIVVSDVPVSDADIADAVAQKLEVNSEETGSWTFPAHASLPAVC
jgi:hypothetical protein